MVDTSFDTDFLDAFCGDVAEGDDGTIASCMIYNVSFFNRTNEKEEPKSALKSRQKNGKIVFQKFLFLTLIFSLLPNAFLLLLLTGFRWSH